MTKVTRLYIVRHGKTDWNHDTRTQGQLDIPLNSEGVSQAQLLAERFADLNISHIYSSDLIRAKETADLIGQKLKLSIESLVGIREMNFGKWQGLTNAEIKERYSTEYNNWRSNPESCEISEGERLIQVQQRGLEIINKISKTHKDANVIIVSHGTAIKAMLLGILGLDLSNFYKFRQDNTAVNIVQYKDYGPVLVRLNCTCHLDKDLRKE